MLCFTIRKVLLTFLQDILSCFCLLFCVAATVGAGRCPALEQWILLSWASDAQNVGIRCPEQKSQFGSSVVMTEMRGRGVGSCASYST